MRYITIMLMVLLINLSGSIINAIDKVDPLFYPTFQPDERLYKSGGKLTEAEIADEEYFQSPGIQDTQSITFGDYLVGFFKFIKVMFAGILLPFVTYKSFGVPTNIAYLLSIPVYFTYLVGMYQFISNRAAKGMY